MSTLRWGSATDVGMVREANQDAFLVDSPLFAVADGMGGHQGGEVAAATALEVLKASFTDKTKEDLLEAVRRANAKVWDKGQLDDTLHGMGTTLVGVAEVKDDEGAQVFALINVGDSRGYLYRDSELLQITTDHSLVEEMVRAGELSDEEAETHPRRNILTRALGVEPTVEVDLDMVVPRDGDRILLCSDGLVRELVDSQIAGVLQRLKNPEEVAIELVNQAKAHGGHDNITVVIVDVVGDEQSPVTIDVPRAAKPVKAPKAPKVKAPRPEAHTIKITFRMMTFFVALAALIVLGCGSVVWYARSSYYVGTDGPAGQEIIIYKGRADAVLWFHPTIAERTNVLLSQVLPSRTAQLHAGEAESSLRAAQQYVVNLTTEAQEAQVADAGTTTTTTTIDPTSTTTVVTTPQ